MNLIPILAVAEKTHVTPMDALPHLLGMLMVLFTLTVLWGVCALTAKLIKTFMPETLAPAPKPAPAAIPDPLVPTQDITPEIVAVVAAAVATVTGRAHRIVSIKRQSTGWEKAGRQSVLSSHRIR
jgi:Na+-transporting methylmalonyl-CoA/oxaloacetate decarboxylase gamma subunit